MRDEKKYTERDVVLRERRAWVNGWRFGAMPLSDASAEAEKIYPLPRQTQPRVVRFSNREWRVVGGLLQSRRPCEAKGPFDYFPAAATPWTSRAQITPTPEMVALLADLLANPTEEVSE